MKALKKYKFNPDYAVPPGETIYEVCKSMHMTQKEMAGRLGITEQSFIRIKRGLQPLTYSTANKLELVTGIPASYWNQLEANYREIVTRLNEREELQKGIAWLKKFPIKKLIEWGYVIDADNNIDKLRNLLKFFGVSSINAWEETYKTIPIAARKSSCYDTSRFSLTAWIRCGEVKAASINCKPFDKQKFQNTLPKIRKLTREDFPTALLETIKLCSQCGVALAVVPHFTKLPYNGASKWVTPNNALIIMSLRGKSEDKFWFSFFHEAAHILKHKKELYIADINNDILEKEADDFAAEQLIPEKYNSKISNFRMDSDIILFASEIDISPGIIVGRYQFITKKWTHFRNLIKSINLNDCFYKKISIMPEDVHMIN